MKNTGDAGWHQGSAEEKLAERHPHLLEDIDASNQWCRKQELFVHLRDDLPYPVRVLCRIILGRQHNEGLQPTLDLDTWCTSGRLGLGRDIGGKSKSRVSELIGEARDAGLLTRTTTVDDRLRTIVWVEPTEEMREWIKTLWHRTKTTSRLRKWKTELLDRGQLVDRMQWFRAIRDHTAMATTTKAVAFGVDALLRRRTGLVARKTTVGELEQLSGCWERVVRRELRNLEDGGWLVVRRKRGRNGGLWPRATFPQDPSELAAAPD